MVESKRPWAARPRRSALALLAVLALGLLQTPGSAPAQTQPAYAGPCTSQPADGPGSCSGEPLDYRATRRGDIRTIADLPQARLGRAYRTPVIRGGVPAYVFDQAIGLPPGLNVTADGLLTGTPTRAGSYRVHLEAHDSASPLNIVRGDWFLQIAGAPQPAKPAKPAQQRSEPQTHVTPQPVAVGPPGELVTYSLSQKNLVDLNARVLADAQAQAAAQAAAQAKAAAQTQTQAQAQTPAATTSKASQVPPAQPAPTQSVALLGASPPANPPAVKSPSASPAPPPPAPGTSAAPANCIASDPPAPADPATPATLGACLGPIMNAEYPDQSLFEAAIKYHLGGQSALYSQYKDEIIKIAIKRQNYFAAPLLNWAAEPSCGCVRPPPADLSRTVYGFFPFWRSNPKSAPIDFSLFDRIGLVGAQLAQTGQWIRPSSATVSEAQWWRKASEFARVAQSHGTKLDLVLQQNDWNALRNLSGIQIDGAARRAVMLADTPLTDSGVFARGFLWSVWPKPRSVFDGVTVMFTPPPGGSGDRQAFYQFFDRFTLQLIANMQAAKHPFRLNIVLTDDEFCLAGSGHVCDGPNVFNPVNLMHYKHLAEPADQIPKLSQAERLNYRGVTPISVKFIVILKEFTGETKKTLREDIDQLEDNGGENDFEGPARTTLLHSIIPVVFEPAGQADPAQSAPNTAFDKSRISYDMAYFDENFGGVGVWPVPQRGVDAGTAFNAAAKTAFLGPNPKIFGLSFQYVCNTALRLIWQLAVILIVVGLALYALSDASSSTRRLFLYGTIGAAAVAVILGFVLLELDPALDAIKTGNKILYAVVGAFALIALWVGFRPRVRDP